MQKWEKEIKKERETSVLMRGWHVEDQLCPAFAGAVGLA